MIFEVSTRCTYVVEAQNVVEAEELVADLICNTTSHPSMLEDPDPRVRGHRVG